MPTHVISANGTEADPTTGDVQIPIYKSETILYDADIKALPTTYPELVPAPGVGKGIVFLGAAMAFDFSGGSYTNTDGSTAFFVSNDGYHDYISSLFTLPGGAGKSWITTPPMTAQATITGLSYLQQ